jgi:hypothetical protein
MDKLEDIFNYLLTCKKYEGEPQQGARRAFEKIANFCMAVGACALILVLIAGVVHKYIHPFTPSQKGWTVLFALLGEFVMFLAVPIQMVLGYLAFKDERRKKPFETRVREHDQESARFLMSFPDELLGYAKDWLKIRMDRIERPTAFLVGSNVALVPLIALVFSSIRWVEDLQQSLEKIHIYLLPSVAPIAIVIMVVTLTAFFFASIWSSRMAVLKKTYQFELLDIALKMKALEASAGSGNLEQWQSL